MKTKKGKWWGLMIHHTATSKQATVEVIRKLHKARGWDDVGYHYLVMIDLAGRGHLKEGRSTKYVGAHAGVAKYNENYIGLAVMGNYSENSMGEQLYQDVLAAAVHICKKYQMKSVLGHRDIKATQCPGNNFPLARLKEDLKKILGADMVTNKDVAEAQALAEKCFKAGYIQDLELWKGYFAGDYTCKPGNLRALIKNILNKEGKK